MTIVDTSRSKDNNNNNTMNFLFCRHNIDSKHYLMTLFIIRNNKIPLLNCMFQLK